MRPVMNILISPLAAIIRWFRQMAEDPQLRRLERKIEDLEIAIGAIQGELAVLRRIHDGILAALPLYTTRGHVRRLRGETIEDILRREIE